MKKINVSKARGLIGDDISLNRFKSGCHADAKTIVAKDQIIEDSGVEVASVKAKKIRVVGTDTETTSGKEIEYAGRFVVTYKEDTLVHPLRPIEIPLQFTSDQAGNILECGSITDHRTRLKSIDYNLDGAITAREMETRQQKYNSR